MRLHALTRWAAIVLLGPTLIVPVRSWHVHSHEHHAAEADAGHFAAGEYASTADAEYAAGAAAARATRCREAPGGDAALCAACIIATLTPHAAAAPAAIVLAATPAAAQARPVPAFVSHHRLPITGRGPPLV